MYKRIYGHFIRLFGAIPFFYIVFPLGSIVLPVVVDSGSISRHI